MEIIPIKTRIVNPPKDDIYDLFENLDLKEKDVLLITSKILAIHQGKTVLMSEVKDKDDLIKKEADLFIPREEVPGEHVILTVKNNTLIPSAGIDESNADGYYILWPEKPEKEAKKICEYLKEKYKLKELAVIITDSHTTPLRWGVMGISTGFYGLNPLKDYRGHKDIFGREIKMTQSNIVDALAVIGVLAMGEGDERSPIAIARGVENIEFTEKEMYENTLIPTEEDIYYPLLKKFWEKK